MYTGHPLLSYIDENGNKCVFERGINDDVFVATLYEDEGTQDAVIINKDKLIEYAKLLKEE